MPKPTPAPVASDKLQLYEKLVATNPSVKRKGATVPYTSLNGHEQPEYVEVPASLLSSTRELKKFFDASYSYVASLKPKPTARKKKL